MKLIEMRKFSSGFIKNINLQINSDEIILLCGQNFSGKSSILRAMKKNLLLDFSGIANFFLDANQISYVPQNSDMYFILSTVRDELTFQMENMHFDTFSVNKKLAEFANFFVIANLLDKNINELSDGQKRLISLCSAIITRPKIILLDDVFNQLDTVTKNNLLNLIKLMHNNFGISFVIASSNLSNLINICERIIFVNDGRIVFDDPTEVALGKLFLSPFKSFLPNVLDTQDLFFDPQINYKKNITLQIKNVSYKYNKYDKFVINNLSWNLFGKINCLFGANGCGKTTLLKLIAKFIKPYCGGIKYFSHHIKYMPQNILALFSQNTFASQIKECEDKEFVSELLEIFHVSFALDENIYELSPSCQQILGFIYVISSKPDILLLDEPTKFLDKNNIDAMKKTLINLDSTAIIATHDIEFGSSIADRCLMLFDGNIAYEQEPSKFFSDNSFYYLPVNKIARLKFKN